MTDPDLVVITGLGTVALVMALVATLQKNLIRAVVAYALASASLAGIFFLLDSPYAGAFELTVGAGLVAVLFLVALVLSGGEEEEVPA